MMNSFKRLVHSIFPIKSNASTVRFQRLKISDKETDGLKGSVKSTNSLPFAIQPMDGRLIKVEPIYGIQDYGCYYFVYNRLGNKIERRQAFTEYESVEGDFYYGFRYFYSEDGLLTYSCFYDFDESIGDFYTDSRVVFKYNISGEIIAEEEYDRSDNLKKTIHKKYDVNGNLIERLVVPFVSSFSREIRDRSVYYYDEKNNLIREESYYNYSRYIQETTTYKYNWSNKLINKITINSKHNSKVEESLCYNEYGDIKEKISNGKKTVYTYKYDNIGNWISQEACEIDYIIKDDDYSNPEISHWLAVSGGCTIMGTRLLIEREIIYY
jgi:hypothetical protein